MARPLRALAVAVWLGSCGESPAAREPVQLAGAPGAGERPTLIEATHPAGLDFAHENGATGKRWFVENTGAGAALFDCDEDGDLDLLLRQGGPLDPATPAEAPRPTDRLYRNDLDPDAGAGGTARFVDTTAGSGFDVPAYGMGMATGDFDADGHVDIYLTNFGAGRLLRGLGHCRFEDVTARAGAENSHWSVAATFFDADGDGDLDLFIGNYVEYSVARDRICHRSDSSVDYCGPLTYPAVPDRLLFNLGSGRFEDATRRAGFDAVEPGRALGAVAFDADRDGRTDLFVANDATENHLWRNLGAGRFAEESIERGVALNGAGLRTGDMGVEAADLDEDGDFDLASTHIDTEGLGYWLNDGAGFFWESAAASGLLAATLLDTGFGIAAFDYDADGRLDLFTANGAVRAVERLLIEGDPRPLRQRNRLLRNAGGGRFEDVTTTAGDALAPAEVGRGLAAGDVDNDGDLDLVVTNNGGPARLLLSNASEMSPWLGLRLLGRDGREALGAEAVLRCSDGRSLIRRAHTDGSYASAGDPRVLFALGGCETIGTLNVTWPSGAHESFETPALGAYAVLRDGDGLSVAKRLSP